MTALENEFPYLLEMTSHSDERGGLLVFDPESMPFQVNRFFFMTPRTSNSERGNHGHYKCWQLITSAKASFRVQWKKGSVSGLYELTPGSILVIPPMVWIKIVFETVDAIALICSSDRFEASDIFI